MVAENISNLQLCLKCKLELEVDFHLLLSLFFVLLKSGFKPNLIPNLRARLLIAV